MADTVDYNIAVGGTLSLANKFRAPLYLMKQVVDIPAVIAAGHAAGKLASATKITSGECIGLFNIPAHTVVLAVYTKIVTVGTASATIDIGSPGTETLFDAAIALDAAAGTTTGSEADAGAMGAALSGSRVDTAYNLMFQSNTDILIGKFVVMALVLDIDDDTAA